MSCTSAVGIIDYGRGNLRSVAKAVEAAGMCPLLVGGPPLPEGLDALIFPGVGSFGDCAASLDSRRLRAPILEWLASGRPFLGVCLGYQMLFSESQESPGAQGLGFFRGTVRRFSSPGLKIPHMGWNQLRPTPGSPLFEGVAPGAGVYFVHSYFPCPEEPGIVTATSDYGGEFAAACGLGNVHAVQFHPEKSQLVGLKILRNFRSMLPEG